MTRGNAVWVLLCDRKMEMVIVLPLVRVEDQLLGLRLRFVHTRPFLYLPEFISNSGEERERPCLCCKDAPRETYRADQTVG